MSNDDMRFLVAKAYGPNAKNWKRKVAKMSDEQVCALYYSFVQRGLIKQRAETTGVKNREHDTKQKIP